MLFVNGGMKMPTENFMSCSINDSGEMDPKSFRTQRREHEGKSYNVLLGRKPNERGLTEVTYNYPKDVWDAEEMQTHCESHGGHVKKTKELSMDDIEKRTRKCTYCGKRANKRVISKDGHVIPVDTECLGKAIHDMEQSGEDDCHVIDIPIEPNNPDAPYTFSHKIAKIDSALHIISGPVLVPDVVDLQDQVISAEEIRKTAHLFMREFNRMNYMHDESQSALMSDVNVVESAVLYNDVDYYGVGSVLKQGTWILSVEIPEGPLWKQIEDGQITAFSIEGWATLVEEDTNA